MKTQLYKLTEENFETLFSYYDVIMEKSKKYYSYLTQFIKITNNYRLNIQKIFFDEKDIFDSDENLKSKITLKENFNKYYNIDINLTNKTINKNIDISPIEKNIDKINDIIKNYLNCISLFNKSIENQIVYINQNIEQLEPKINEIKNNYLVEKKNFLQKYSEFDILNKKLLMKYTEQEKNLIQFILKAKALKDTESDENDLNVKIFETKQFQIDLEKEYKKLGNFGYIFNDFYKKGIKKIKEMISLFCKNFEAQINNILILYKKSFLVNINQLASGQENLELKNNICNDILNNTLINFDANLSKIDFDEYQIKIINLNNLNEIDADENEKILINLVKTNHKKLDDKDILYIVKKMYNFNHINKKKYVMEIEKEKIILNGKIDKLFNYGKIKNTKSIWNIFYGIIDTKDKNNEINNNNNDDDEDIFNEDIIVKNEPSQEDVDYICKLMNKKEFSLHFLSRLNNFRSHGSLNMPEKIFFYFVKIFIEISKYITEEAKIDEKGKESKIIKDYNIVNMIFILSQTFYYQKDNQKIYLQNELKNEKIFHSAEFWTELLQYNMQKEVEKNEKKMNIKFNRKEYIEQENKICFMQILPYVNGMIGFGMDKEKIKEVALYFIKKYEVNEEYQNIILSSIENPP